MNGEPGVTLGLPQRDVVVPGEASFAVLLIEQLREVDEQCRSCVRVAPGGDDRPVGMGTRPVRKERTKHRSEQAGAPLSARQVSGAAIGCPPCAWRRSP
jgi:hypothetical protein